MLTFLLSYDTIKHVQMSINLTSLHIQCTESNLHITDKYPVSKQVFLLFSIHSVQIFNLNSSQFLNGTSNIFLRKAYNSLDNICEKSRNWFWISGITALIYQCVICIRNYNVPLLTKTMVTDGQKDREMGYRSSGSSGSSRLADNI